MIANAVLETPRLLVRPFGVADVVTLVALFADPAVAQFVGDGQPLSEEDASLWVRRSAENLSRHGYGTGAVIRREDHAMIGWAGFARPQEGPEQVIYGLGAAHWGQGYGKEILKALVDFADARDHSSVWATVDPANAASIRLLDQTGFVLVERGHQGDPDSDLYQRSAAFGP